MFDLKKWFSGKEKSKDSKIQEDNNIEDNTNKNKDKNSKTPENNKEETYHSLAPTNKAEGIKPYKDALNWALKDEDIKNIAITGGFSSGKSSFIKTFLKNRDDNDKFLNISLATFDLKEKNEGEKTPEEIKEQEKTLKLIELSILQQIFYHEDESKIPDSRFKKIKSLPPEDLREYSALSILYILAFIHLFYPVICRKITFFPSWICWEKLNPWISTASIIFLVTISFYYLAPKLIRLIKGLTLKLKIDNLEIAIDEKNDKSILNHHIDEILYFFEVTDYEFVIIEDLDRFEETRIFTKLREINSLINNSKKIEKKIVFIYAVKDQHLKDRTKFFDFIIPIIPTINYSNSNEIIKSINENNTKYKISEDLINDIGLYIEDMRLLYNIMNEYTIYSERQNFTKEQRKNDKLFSLIIYKNIFPKDFSKLSTKQGDLYNIISNKNIYRNKEKEKIDNKIEIKREKIKPLKELKIKDLKELRTLYLAKIVEEINQQNPRNSFYSFFINNNIYSLLEATEDEIFEVIINNVSIQYKYEQSYHQNFTYKFNQIEDAVDPINNYNERETLIIDFINNGINKLEKEIRELEIDKNNLNKKKLKDIISKDNIEERFKEDNKNLVYFLLKNGFIAEDFIDYISVFHQGDIEKEDRDFLMNVKNEELSDYDYSLSKKKEVLKRINTLDFEKEYILVFNLIDCLINQKNSSFKEKKERLFLQLGNEEESSVKFIKEFIKETSNKKLFIKKLCSNWHNIFNFINSSDSTFSEKETEKFFKYIIQYAEISDIEEIFKDAGIINFINTRDDNFLKIIDDEERLKNIIKKLDINFTDLDIKYSPNELLDFIYENNFYSIEKNIVEKIIRYKDAPNLIDFKSKNYSLIKKSKLDNLIEYIDANIKDYIKNIYLKLDSKNEDEKYLIELLNNPDIFIKNKELIIRTNSTKIEDIRSIKNIDVINLLFKESKVQPTWNNIIDTYIESENILTEDIILFLNNEENSKEISKKKIPKEYPDKETVYTFLKSILLEKDIDDKIYELLLKSIPYIYDPSSLRYENLKPEKIKLLIKNNILIINDKNFQKLKITFEEENFHILLGEKNPIKLIDDIEDFNDLEVDILKLLKSQNISPEIKEQIINKLTADYLYNDSNLLNQVAKILSENLDFKFEDELTKKIVKNSNLSSSNKLKIFNKYYQLFNNEDLDEMLNNMGGKFLDINRNSNKHPLIENDHINKEFINILKIIKYISPKSKPEKKGIRIYKLQR